MLRRYAGGQSYTIETIATADDTIDADGAIVLTFAQAQTVARQRFVDGKRTTAGLSSHQAGPYRPNCMAEYLAWLETNSEIRRISRWTTEAFILPELGATPANKLDNRHPCPLAE